MNTDEQWMQIAIQEAMVAENEGEVPVGAVLVQDGKMIAKAHNQPILKSDPTAHAEIQVLRISSEIINNYRLLDSCLYVTLEPCIMCFGAMVHARIDRVVFGAFDPKSGACGSCINLNSKKAFNHEIIILGGILESECRKILHSFFQNRRRQKK
jgi:tRNA(adenine34) deaminase